MPPIPFQREVSDFSRDDWRWPRCTVLCFRVFYGDPPFNSALFFHVFLIQEFQVAHLMSCNHDLRGIKGIAIGFTSEATWHKQKRQASRKIQDKCLKNLQEYIGIESF